MLLRVCVFDCTCACVSAWLCGVSGVLNVLAMVVNVLFHVCVCMCRCACVFACMGVCVMYPAY